MKSNNRKASAKIILVLSVLIFSFTTVSAVECGSIPTDGCIITQNTTFNTGAYNLPNGINLETHGITLDCNNSVLIGGASSSKGIELYGDRYQNVIKNCNMNNYTYGIYMWYNGGIGTDSNNIFLNSFDNNTYGIYLGYEADYNNITQNVFKNNSQGGAYVYDQTTNLNTIWNNTVYDKINYRFTGDTQYVYNGIENIYLNGATGPTAQGLYIYDGLGIDSTRSFIPGVYNAGIAFAASHVEFNCNNSIVLNNTSHGEYSKGIEINYYSYNNITNCNISNFYYGILVWDYADYNNIVWNSLENNFYGLDIISPATNNNVMDNIFKNNENYGVYLAIGQVNYNLIWKNDFIDNHIQAADAGTNNYWNSSGEGNYWNNYDTEAEGCFDNNSDLSCDTPFNIGSSSKDYLPLTGVKITDILPIQVVKDVNMVEGKTTLVRTTLKNVGVSDRNISISLFFDGNLKATENETINSGESKYSDLFFIPDVSGNSKEIRMEAKKNG